MLISKTAFIAVDRQAGSLGEVYVDDGRAKISPNLTFSDVSVTTNNGAFTIVM